MFPFDSERKRMSSIRKVGKEELLFVKGAPQSVLEQCSHMFDGEKIRPLRQRDREFFMQQHMDWATQAMRNLAFAYKPMK